MSGRGKRGSEAASQADRTPLVTLQTASEQQLSSYGVTMLKTCVSSNLSTTTSYFGIWSAIDYPFTQAILFQIVAQNRDQVVKSVVYEVKYTTTSADMGGGGRL